MRMIKIPFTVGDEYLVRAESEDGQVRFVVAMWMGDKFLSFFDEDSGEDTLHEKTITGYVPVENRK